jgi:hypothetical protein
MPEKKWAVRRPVLPNRDFNVWCVDRTVDEGRKAAMRWLIEFVGIRLDKNDNVARPIAHDNGKSVTIEQAGGRMFETSSEDVRKLAKVWQVCSQASGHPTMDTSHDPLDPGDLASALKIVIAHLEAALFNPSRRDLWKIVREQEELAIARERHRQQTNA